MIEEMLNFPSVIEAYANAIRDLEIQDRDRYSLEVYTFPQTWGSTALGFGGVGGAAMTSAYVVIVVCGRKTATYFGSRLAYIIENPNMKFWEDVHSHNMADVFDSARYRRPE